MREFFAIGLLTLGIVGASGQQQNGRAANRAGEKTPDACSLLSKAVIQKVQGEPVTASKASSAISGAAITAQCFYSLPDSQQFHQRCVDFARSVKVIGSRPPRAVAAVVPRRFGKRT